jgi:trehalose 6-phosphate phosphatase
VKAILARPQRRLLEQVAWSEVLLAFDFDGTLAPIVSAREDAAMTATTRRLLGEVALRYPCVVLSGRSRADLTPRLRGLPLREIVGNHGLEPPSGLGRRTARFAAQVARWAPQLVRALRPHQGVVVENKGVSMAVHFRASREKSRARRAILDALAPLGPLRILGGKQVINVLPPGATDKGLALEAARRRAGCEAALYVGDDETDEDVFALRAGRTLGIRVGRRRGSRAEYYLRDRDEIDVLLGLLRDLRAATRTRATG